MSSGLLFIPMDPRFSVDEIRLNDREVARSIRRAWSPFGPLTGRAEGSHLLDLGLLALTLAADGQGRFGFLSFEPVIEGGWMGQREGDRSSPSEEFGGPTLWERVGRGEFPVGVGEADSAPRGVANRLLYGYGGYAANLIAASKACLRGPLGLEQRLLSLLQGSPASSRRRAHAWIELAMRHGFLLSPRDEKPLFPISRPCWDDLCARGFITPQTQRGRTGRVRYAWESLGALRVADAADRVAQILGSF